MKTATILPQAYLHMIKDDEYHMALAHLLDAPGYKQYSWFYEEIGQRNDTFLIMDTGLIEGNARPIEELVAKAQKYMVEEMVMNDVFMDAEATLKESAKALEYVNKHHPKVRKMVVPQGTCLEEWVECAQEMLTWGIDTIGVPKILTHLEGTHGRLRALMKIQDVLGDTDVHLLGCWESPLELKYIEGATRQGVIKPVRGVDSVIAYAYARHGLRISEDERPEGAIDFQAKDANELILAYNIELWKSEAATLPPLTEANKVQRLW